MANMIPIQTVTVGSGGASSIDFTNIPQNYTDLKVVSSARTDTVNNVQNLYVKINNDTAANYTSRSLYALNTNTPASISASADTKTQWDGYAVGNSATASTFSNYEFYIPNYTSSNYKSISADVVTENNSVNNILLLTANLWSSSSPINTLSIYPATGNFTQYSSATLYGIRKY